MILRGLVLKEPWAWACVHAGKDVENRSRPLRHRGPLVIVAGAKLDIEYFRDAIVYMLKHCGPLPEPPSGDFELGGIVGCVEMFDVATPDQFPATKWHMEGQYGYRIRKAVPLPFRPLKGHQGLMRIEMTAKEIATIERGGIRCQGA